MSNLFCFDTCFDIHGNVWQQVTSAIVCWEYFRSKGRLDLTLLFRHRTSSMSSLLGDVDLLVKLSIWHNYIRFSSHLGGEAISSLFLWVFVPTSTRQQEHDMTNKCEPHDIMTSSCECWLKAGCVQQGWISRHGHPDFSRPGRRQLFARPLAENVSHSRCDLTAWLKKELHQIKKVFLLPSAQ